MLLVHPWFHVAQSATSIASKLVWVYRGPDEDNLLEYEAAQQRWRKPLMAFAFKNLFGK